MLVQRPLLALCLGVVALAGCELITRPGDFHLVADAARLDSGRDDAAPMDVRTDLVAPPDDRLDVPPAIDIVDQVIADSSNPGDCSRATCGDACVDLQTDRANCGACGTACPTGGAQVTSSDCVAGVCSLMCVAGFGDCDRTAGNGCEAPLSSMANCGACGRSCAVGPRASAANCIAGSCQQTCNPGFADCNGLSADGCEVDTATSATNCSSCGRVCASGANSAPACAGGVCTVSCNMGFGDCDLNPANGCEVNLNTDAMRCGSCLNNCTLDPGSVCVAATCCRQNVAPNCAVSPCGAGPCVESGGRVYCC